MTFFRIDVYQLAQQRFLPNCLLRELMPPKESTESRESKSSTLAKYFPYEFMVLLSYLRHAPKSVFDLFAPYVIYLGSQKHKNEEIVRAAVHNIKKRRIPLTMQINKEKQQIFECIIQLLDLQSFFKAIELNQSKFLSFMKFWEKRNQQDDQYFYQTSIKINLLRPGYFLTEQIAKEEAQSKIGERFKEQDSKFSFFYKQPRFSDKLAELIHFKKNKCHQGEIALLQYTGNFITGNRVYAVVKGSQFDIWQKTSSRVPYPFFDENQEAIPPDSDEQKSGDETESWRKPPPSFELERSYHFLGHTSKITCASLSQDQLYIITGSVDRSVKLWCLRLNICLATYKAHLKTVWDVHFNPSGLYFLSGGADGLMILWKTDNSRPQRLFMHKDDIYKVHFGRNPSYAISAGEEGLLKIWDIVESKIMAVIKTDQPIINFSLGHSGIYILVLEVDGRVTLHNTSLGIIISSFYFYFQLQGQSAKTRQIIHDCCFSEDQQNITCVTNRHVLLYSVQTLEMSISSQKSLLTSKREGSREKIVTPSLVLMSVNNLRFNYCRYRHRGLLVIGATKYLP